MYSTTVKLSKINYRILSYRIITLSLSEHGVYVEQSSKGMSAGSPSKKTRTW